jgi:hypothetical protein
LAANRALLAESLAQRAAKEGEQARAAAESERDQKERALLAESVQRAIAERTTKEREVALAAAERERDQKELARAAAEKARYFNNVNSAALYSIVPRFGWHWVCS